MALPERARLQGRAGVIPHPVPQHGRALLHHARHPIGLLHLVCRPARLLLCLAAKVALHRSIQQLVRTPFGSVQGS